MLYTMAFTMGSIKMNSNEEGTQLGMMRNARNDLAHLHAMGLETVRKILEL